MTAAVHPVPPSGFARSYILVGAKKLAVVDVGSIGAVEDICRYIDALGRSLREVRWIVATHFHVDHIGGLGHLLDRCGPEARVVLHARARHYETGRARLSAMTGWGALLPVSLRTVQDLRRPAHLVVESLAGIPLPGIRRFARLAVEEGRIRYAAPAVSTLGLEDWLIVETPGHTEDSLSLYSPAAEALICGDLVLNVRNDGRGQLNRFCWNRTVCRETWRRLTGAFPARTVYPGHGNPISLEGNALAAIQVYDA